MVGIPSYLLKVLIRATGQTISFWLREPKKEVKTWCGCRVAKSYQSDARYGVAADD
jgi:hypothetical protein